MEFKFYNMKEMGDLTTETIATRQKQTRGEICFYFHHAIGDTAWCNKAEIQEESKRSRKLVKKGLLTMREENNKTLEIDGKNYHLFVVQHTDDTSNNIDPLAMANGLMVDGWVYFFTQKHNRDVLYKYIMNKK
jgi:hypothetical protein